MKIRALIKRLQEIEARHGDVEVIDHSGQEITQAAEYNKDGTCAFAHPENGPVNGVLLQ